MICKNRCRKDILTDTEETDVKNNTESKISDSKICIKRARTILS